MREALVAARQKDDPHRLLKQIAAHGFHMYTLADAGYPLSLKRINAPPPVLYARGDLTACQGISGIGIVGTRKATAYGRQMAKTLAFDLARAGMVVVSGLARGIDSAAHRGALAAGGKTAAVLGSGLDVIYPPENKDLAAEIAAGGVLLSEFPPGTPPLSQNFPRRNRIISGLALGIVVVEAGEKSGALITADLALEQGREVFAVPGPATSPVSVGPNRLIKQGARLVESAADILEELALPRLWEAEVEPAAGAEIALEPAEREVLSALAGGPVQLEVLAAEAGRPVSELLPLLTLLEVRGLVRRLPGGFFISASGDGP
ncbi:MAG: DNA-protecting protein DprA [Clostridia bacterium]|nr:MAG: DNA-protecting protein DprA [Clostridia bacterium]